MTGAPVFFRELLAHSRRPRTYVAQTVFLGILVVAMIPFWNASGAQVADTGRMIFEYGGYLQLILLAMLTPAATANAITEEKDTNTLDLLLLTGAGPFSIVLGKFVSRLVVVLYLLVLTLPLLFALLTLGGVSPTIILAQWAILVAFAVLAAGVGVFFSTILPRTVTVLIASYVVLGLLLSAPEVLRLFDLPATRGFLGGVGPAYLSPFHDLAFVFNPTAFLPTASTADGWWVVPAWNAGAGLALVGVAALLLPYARTLERWFNLRRVFEAIDRATFLVLRPSLLLKGVKPSQVDLPQREGVPDAKVEAIHTSRRLGTTNPIYWKETTVNTVGRFRYWWRINLAIMLLLSGSYLAFQDQLGNIEFHRILVAILAGLIVILCTIIAATTVSREREDGTLLLMATTPVECVTYVEGKVRGIARNIILLVALPFLHVTIFVVTGAISPVTLGLLFLSIPVAVAAAIVQGIFVSLVFPTTLRAIVAAVVVIVVEAVLPLVCCLPTFNLPVACYLTVVPASGMSAQLGPGSGASFAVAWFLASLFSGLTQLGYTFVVYSLIRSGFDRYIGRGA